MKVWDKTSVEMLISTAAKIENRLPQVVVGKCVNNWRDIENSGQGIYRDQNVQGCRTPQRTSSGELYDEVMKLLTWLNNIDPCKYYNKIIWARAIGTETHVTARKCGMSPSSVNRYCNKGIALLVEHLNGLGSNMFPAINIFFTSCVR